jgi:hypothetical protein
MQTADWQLLFSDRFTGARNPARLPTKDTIPSNPLRPLSSPILAPMGAQEPGFVLSFWDYQDSQFGAKQRNEVSFGVE